MQKQTESFTFNLPQSNVEGRVFEWSADGKVWTSLTGIASDQISLMIDNLDPSARLLRMRNTSDKQMGLKISSFSVKTKDISDMDDELLMYDLNLKTYEVLKAGDKVNVTLWICRLYRIRQGIVERYTEVNHNSGW